MTLCTGPIIGLVDTDVLEDRHQGRTEIVKGLLGFPDIENLKAIASAETHVVEATRGRKHSAPRIVPGRGCGRVDHGVIVWCAV